MTGLEVFLWGAWGGLIFELLQLFEFLRASSTIRRSRAWLVAPVMVAFSLVGGLMAFLVLGGTSDYRPAAALFVGFGGTALLPLLSRAQLGESSKPSHEAPKVATGEARLSQASSGALNMFAWWTADRVRTLLMAAALIVAFLTYLAK